MKNLKHRNENSMTDKEKYDFIDHVVHLTLLEEDRLLEEHGGDYSGLEEDGIDSNEYYRIITEKVINILKMNNNYMQEEPVSEDLVDKTQTIIYNGEVYTRCYKDELDAFACKYPMSVPKTSKKYAKYSDVDLTIAIKEGAKWQKEQLMKDAIDAVVHIDAGNYPYIPEIELYDYDKNEPLAKEGEKYKVVLIKKD